ncbi:putative metalloprotease CJM1_0395 family protein [Pontibacillus sp. HMF3514]|uniref:putative metalloprotease CJM1_0395 family protein n=1 Tax=Pontibacillus sp. HMF3514 TaxID=2692425 RepID=UPI00131F98F9|nr:putative metalloprotease CJM1_0395 family protein [Pontibacillus sp. HMF3514]QHE53957.1 hypothetical protein GS400_18870 [Pontibacillus sp. HMF3514]
MNSVQGNPQHAVYNSIVRSSNHSVQNQFDSNHSHKNVPSSNSERVALDTEKKDLHYGEQLSPEQKRQISELKAVEQKVKAHEQAHRSVGGKFAGGISYDFQKGPDGQEYIIGGEVPVQMPKSEDPEETIQAMEQVRRAALSPANPSSQDMQVASKASQAILEAQSEMKSKENKNADEQHHEDIRNQAIQKYQQQQGAFMRKPQTIFDQSA